MASIIEGRMDVLVPAPLLETAELIPSAKLVWVGLALDADEDGKAPPTYTVLAERLGLCRQTVSKAVARLRTLGWYSDEAGIGARPARAAGKQTRVVAELILETSLSVAARLTYMQIQLELELQPEPHRQLRTRQQATPGTRAKGLVLRFASLGKTLGRGAKALRNAVRELVRAKWLSFEQTNRVAPVSVAPGNAIRASSCRASPLDSTLHGVTATQSAT